MSLPLPHLPVAGGHVEKDEAIRGRVGDAVWLLVKQITQDWGRMIRVLEVPRTSQVERFTRLPVGGLSVLSPCSKQECTPSRADSLALSTGHDWQIAADNQARFDLSRGSLFEPEGNAGREIGGPFHPYSDPFRRFGIVWKRAVDEVVGLVKVPYGFIEDSAAAVREAIIGDGTCLRVKGGVRPQTRDTSGELTASNSTTISIHPCTRRVQEDPDVQVSEGALIDDHPSALEVHSESAPITAVTAFAPRSRLVDGLPTIHTPQVGKNLHLFSTPS